VRLSNGQAGSEASAAARHRKNHRDMVVSGWTGTWAAGGWSLTPMRMFRVSASAASASARKVTRYVKTQIRSPQQRARGV